MPNSTTQPSARTFAPRPASFDGFVRREGTELFDGAGRELLLRGVGLGNWMLPEGYMWRFGPGAESPREIEALVERLVGASDAEAVLADVPRRFITERDIARDRRERVRPRAPADQLARHPGCRRHAPSRRATR